MKKNILIVDLEATCCNDYSIPRAETETLGMAAALRRTGQALEGTHHRGIDDARNMARLLPYIFGESAIGRNRRHPLEDGVGHVQR